jgi:predicted Holliday junction resolvase-like endonuclease
MWVTIIALGVLGVLIVLVYFALLSDLKNLRQIVNAKVRTHNEQLDNLARRLKALEVAARNKIELDEAEKLIDKSEIKDDKMRFTLD